jgi:hypothetical protein
MKHNFASKVLKNVQVQQEKFKGTSRWLNKAIKFNQDLQLTTKQKQSLHPIFEDLQISSRKENIFNFEVLMANFLEHRDDLRPIAISLDKNTWKKDKYNKVGYSVIKIIGELEKRGYVQVKKGFQTEQDSRLTRIWPGEKLLDYLRILPGGVIYEPVQLVELRDRKTKKLKDYRDTERTCKIRNMLEKANKINGKADIRFQAWELKTFLKAIFIEKFTWYGRLHTRGYRHYQGLTKVERSEITINGEPIIELDFKGLHPHLFYAKEGLQCPDDPYSIINIDPDVRPFLKHILLCMVNAKDEVQAERAANYWLKFHPREYRKLLSKNITGAKPLMKSFLEVHEPISRYFCNGKENGLKVMNLDATIALNIVNCFAKKRIPILAIHDSFIVQEKHEKELYQVMKNSYKKFAGNFDIGITVQNRN